MPRIRNEVKEALLEGTKKSLPTIYRMIEKERVRLLLPNNSKGRNTAANYLASQFVDVSKCGLEKEELDEIRNLQRVAPPTFSHIPTKKTNKTGECKVMLSVDSKLVETFGLPKNIAKDVKMMAEVYPMVYSLENLVRYIIIKVMSGVHGENWWDECNMSRKIKDDVEKRMKDEDENRWHGKRGSHQIFYTDFNDLKSIIVNNWVQFKEIFPDQIWVQSRLKDIEPSRNIIAHNNPLPKREIKRIRMVVEDFRKQLKRFTN